MWQKAVSMGHTERIELTTQIDLARKFCQPFLFAEIVTSLSRLPTYSLSLSYFYSIYKAYRIAT